ncbi:hypothetical protein ACFOMD_15795 [Sphingoaurantiacus capsulatus]|uniref:YCII-related domain-containing protein n=1 Tax=Sphingoaurantiacus capsulatus TaxID=1771310 RepID=A0ABV7XEZ2_9SPHN
MKYLLLTLALLSAVPAVAQPAPAAVSHMTVFNRPGPEFAKAHDPANRALIIAHQRLYQQFAREGVLIAGGRFEGEPVLGLSVFTLDVDRGAVRRALEEDPAVKAGIVAIEFRDWQLQMGGLARPAGD